MTSTIYHPRPGNPGPPFHGNVMWNAPLSAEGVPARDASVACLHARGYEAGAFDANDGIWFNKTPYDPVRGEADIRDCFPWLTFA